LSADFVKHLDESCFWHYNMDRNSYRKEGLS